MVQSCHHHHHRTHDYGLWWADTLISTWNHTSNTRQPRRLPILGLSCGTYMNQVREVYLLAFHSHRRRRCRCRCLRLDQWSGVVGRAHIKTKCRCWRRLISVISIKAERCLEVFVCEVLEGSLLSFLLNINWSLTLAFRSLPNGLIWRFIILIELKKG